MMAKWEKVGVIGVDAGLCWVGDPSYVLPSTGGDGDTAAEWRDWGKFSDEMVGSNAHQFNYRAGHAGLGVCVSTGYGDGLYPVEIKRNKEGRVAEVRVKFI